MGVTEHTYAMVVAVESYANLGDSWKLQGVGAQAAAFAEWLIKDRGVPAHNIQVFQTGSEIKLFKSLGIEAKQIQSATAESINSFIASIGANWPHGELLLIYWIGHGFVARDGGRRLILGDATLHLKSNLDVDQLVRLLRSDQAGSFRRQIAFIDTCAQFFEELQSSSDLPPGGLNAGAPRSGIEQTFYFAASSGEYATKNAFGPRVLELLRRVPSGQWPPNTRWLRNEIEDMFERLVVERSVEQQPAWLEYSDGDKRYARGALPTLADIYMLSSRAGFPINQLRILTELAADCRSLRERIGRDRLYGSIQTKKPLNRPMESAEDVRLDLMRLIAGVIEQGKILALADEVTGIESNSDASFAFSRASQSVETMRTLWPLLVPIKIPLARALVLFKAALPMRSEDWDPTSLEEILNQLIDLPISDPLVEFLVRVTREREGNPNCEALRNVIERNTEWKSIANKVSERLRAEDEETRYLLLEIGKRDETFRVTRSWMWSAHGSAPRELEHLDAEGDLGSDIATLLNEALSEAGGKLCLELLAPERLLHLERGRLAWNNRGTLIDPEKIYPITLRWRDRMEARPRDPSYQTGRWKRAGETIRARLGATGRVSWITKGLSCDEFCQRFDAGQCGELIGIPYPSDGEDLDHLVAYICNGGVPYACWPRCSTVDLIAAERSTQRLAERYLFDEIPRVMFQSRTEHTNPLVDVALLWDDPKRNPYDLKFSDVVQRG